VAFRITAVAFSGTPARPRTWTVFTVRGGTGPETVPTCAAPARVSTRRREACVTMPASGIVKPVTSRIRPTGPPLRVK
jgi:hypothetical protein